MEVLEEYNPEKEYMPGDIVLYKGQGARVARNGALISEQDNKIVKGPSRGGLKRIRRAEIDSAIIAGLCVGADKDDPALAVAQVVARVTDIAVNGRNEHAVLNAAKWLLAITGANDSDSGQNSGSRVQIPENLLAHMLDMIQNNR